MAVDESLDRVGDVGAARHERLLRAVGIVQNGLARAAQALGRREAVSARVREGTDGDLPPQGESTQGGEAVTVQATNHTERSNVGELIRPLLSL
jgi:hypothetical protein